MFSITVVFVVIFALGFEFLNGFNDTANAIATSVYTRALSVGHAILLASSMNFIGALVSQGVAQTIVEEVVNANLQEYVILAAIIGAIIWDLVTWWLAIPSSSSHALIGSLIGATAAYTMSGRNILWGGVLNKVIIPLFTSPLMGLAIGFLIMKLMTHLLASWSPYRANSIFSKLQVVSAAFVAFSHGMNDAQKTMGIITLALITGGYQTGDFHIQIWVKIACATMIMAGTAVGGRRIMKTMGAGVTKLNPVNGFVAQTSSAAIIALMTAFHAPISTTHVITTSVMGVGAAHRVSAVKWGAAKDIILTWVITLPATAIIGGLVCAVVGMFF
ncbi:MAG: inorganic phosphate transporter [Clostridiales Family XIII bacterium]|jgi:PiT family inorganic phosphate transporter|nr:inorganic phosphate transporter [Clostridiales Family XIII bacterium]